MPTGYTASACGCFAARRARRPNEARIPQTSVSTFEPRERHDGIAGTVGQPPNGGHLAFVIDASLLD
jgi:hypothetical protein